MGRTVSGEYKTPSSQVEVRNVLLLGCLNILNERRSWAPPLSYVLVNIHMWDSYKSI